MIFEKPIELAPGLMVMWGDKNSCKFSVERQPREFRAASEQRLFEYGLNALWYRHQKHTADGLCVDAAHAQPGVHIIYDEDGDYLITDQKKTGVAVITADCLPIVIYDPIKKIVAAIHAGWKGTVQGIAAVVVRRMVRDFGCEPRDMRVWFGPHARVCCYEIQPDFFKNVQDAYRSSVIEARNGKFFFDNQLYNKILLKNYSTCPNQIDERFAFCTMCTDQFHSRRNDGSDYVGQSSIAWMI